jgi:hypothetical protein
MTYRQLFVSTLLCLSACEELDAQAPDSTASVPQDLGGAMGSGGSPGIPRWIGPVSEESSRSFALCGQNNVGVTAASCSGAFCDDMSLYCQNLPAGMTTNATPGTWNPYISEESPNNSSFCGSPFAPTGVVDGIRATGSYSDNISIHCSPMTPPSTGYSIACGWTPFFSEENGGQLTFSSPNPANPSFQGPYFAVGVRCSGQFCDNLSFYVCGNVCTACTNNTQCGAGMHCGAGCCGTN